MPAVNHLVVRVLALALLAATSSCKPKEATPATTPPPSSKDSSVNSAPPSTGTPPSDGSNTKTGASSVISLSKEEQASAKEIDGGAVIKETLAAGESKVFRFQHNPASSILAVNSNRLDKPGDPFEAGKAGYCLFDADGKAVGSARVAWNDAPAVEKPAGTFYIKIVGPGEIDIALQ